VGMNVDNTLVSVYRLVSSRHSLCQPIRRCRSTPSSNRFSGWLLMLWGWRGINVCPYWSQPLFFLVVIEERTDMTRFAELGAKKEK
jgi:hypothetical protein